MVITKTTENVRLEDILNRNEFEVKITEDEDGYSKQLFINNGNKVINISLQGIEISYDFNALHNNPLEYSREQLEQHKLLEIYLSGLFNEELEYSFQREKFEDEFDLKYENAGIIIREFFRFYDKVIATISCLKEGKTFRESVQEKIKFEEESLEAYEELRILFKAGNNMYETFLERKDINPETRENLTSIFKINSKFINRLNRMKKFSQSHKEICLKDKAYFFPDRDYIELLKQAVQNLYSKD